VSSYTVLVAATVTIVSEPIREKERGTVCICAGAATCPDDSSRDRCSLAHRSGESHYCQCGRHGYYRSLTDARGPAMLITRNSPSRLSTNHMTYAMQASAHEPITNQLHAAGLCKHIHHCTQWHTNPHEIVPSHTHTRLTALCKGLSE